MFSDINVTVAGPPCVFQWLRVCCLVWVLLCVLHCKGDWVRWPVVPWSKFHGCDAFVCKNSPSNSSVSLWCNALLTVGFLFPVRIHVYFVICVWRMPIADYYILCIWYVLCILCLLISCLSNICLIAGVALYFVYVTRVCLVRFSCG